MYEKQTYSHKNRQLNKTIQIYFRTEQLYEKLHSKHFKKLYAGKPRKKYLKINQQIERAEKIPFNLVEELLSI
jgi:flagella basal body P-ring formation protein FlgA